MASPKASQTLVCNQHGCEMLVVAKGFCWKHYAASRRDPVRERMFEFRRRYKSEWPEAWNDASAFVSDVGRPPSARYRLRKVDRLKPISQENIYWSLPLQTTVSYSEDFHEYHRQSHRLRKFKLTPEAYTVMHKAQNGLCAICREPPTVKWRGSEPSLVVDHCHKTGKVRGLLCLTCNTAIGHLRDSPDLLRAAARYIEAKL